MLKQRARMVSMGLRLLDLAVLVVSFPAAFWLRDLVSPALSPNIEPLATSLPLSSSWPLLALSLLVWELASFSSSLYDQYRTRSLATEVGRMARSLVIVGIVVAAAQFVGKKQADVSRLFFGLYYAIALALLIANRIAIRLAARATRRRGYNSRSFAVVGSGEMAQEIVDAVASHADWGYVFEGYILEDGESAPDDGPVLGRLSEMGDILETHVLDEVIFGVPRERLEGIEEAVLLCEEQGVDVKVLLSFFPNRIAKLTVEEVEGIPMLSFSSRPSDMAPLLGKRLFDIVVSGFVLVLLAPVFLFVAIGIKLDSRGPVFFKQRRVGLNGREFWLFKFRSMCQDAEARLSELREKNEMDGPVFKMRSDPRVTRMGKFIRKTSLDEFPQFWNVLRGEMSVVGPRPPLPREVRLYKRWQRRRLSVKPGITCTWQVSGRNEIDFTQWMQLDLHYIDNWSLWRDVKIVFQTIPAVLLGRGAR